MKRTLGQSNPLYNLFVKYREIGLILIIVLLVKPAGLMGKVVQEKV